MNRVTVVLVVVLIASACTGPQSSGPGSSQNGTPTVSLTDDTSAPSSSILGTSPSSQSDPVDPLDEQVDWFVRTINGDPIDEQSYGSRFSEDFRSEVSFQQFEAGLTILRDVPGDWLVVNVDRGSDSTATVLLAAGDEQAQVLMELAEDGRLGGLLIQPANRASTPATLEEAYNQVTEAGEATLLAAQVEGTSCTPVFARPATEAPIPLGSVIKLYVLGSVATAVAAGDIRWDDEVVVRDELKSVPPGSLANEPAGSVHTVEEVASSMISDSDNTATDLLIDFLGRERIESDLTALGMSDPSLNVPFLTTRELAALKIGPAAGLRTQYLSGDEAEKRQILGQISDLTPSDIPVADVTEPVAPDLLEWFATPLDVCRVLATLWEMGEDEGLEPIRRILTENPGLAPPTGLWDHVAYKGGSEPGLVVVAWLTVAPDGSRYVLVGSAIDTTSVLDELPIIYSFAAARDLLAPTP